MNLVGTDTVFAIHNHPHRHEPFVQAQRGILKDRARLGCELAEIVLAATLPAVILRLEENLLAAASRAGHTIRPTVRNKVLAAVGRIGEIEDGVLKCGRFHASIMP